MSEFQMIDVKALSAALNNLPLNVPQSDKGRYFNLSWWPAHHQEVEDPVLKAISRESDPAFDRRVNIMLIAQRIDSANGNKLAEMGFTPTEITRYVTRAINKRLRQADTNYVIRNQKLTKLAIEHKPS